MERRREPPRRSRRGRRSRGVDEGQVAHAALGGSRRGRAIGAARRTPRPADSDAGDGARSGRAPAESRRAGLPSIRRRISVGRAAGDLDARAELIRPEAGWRETAGELRPSMSCATALPPRAAASQYLACSRRPVAGSRTRATSPAAQTPGSAVRPGRVGGHPPRRRGRFRRATPRPGERRPDDYGVAADPPAVI